ncbi:hypothetical protein BpHYR1_014912 [Brachionus plicatilis]|uniref:Uncharacterized protein n=1 Tax=Brachionus plicatilis TaxID=10195 RepID=A0A3M7R8Z4_BRAPC|nr:hypothetical protein BpHYR1_014912 [Brachionus plicatilis]
MCQRQHCHASLFNLLRKNILELEKFVFYILILVRIWHFNSSNEISVEQINFIYFEIVWLAILILRLSVDRGEDSRNQAYITFIFGKKNIKLPISLLSVMSVEIDLYFNCLRIPSAKLDKRNQLIEQLKIEEKNDSKLLLNPTNCAI